MNQEELKRITEDHKKWLNDEGGARAVLQGADLRGAKINWQSHDLISEILRRAAVFDIEKRKIAGLILISHDWCWDKFLKIGDPLQDWAIDTLKQYVVDGDGAPKALKEQS